jgi:DNA-binding transcriptional regulator YbjK
MMRSRMLIEAACALLSELSYLAPSKELEQIVREAWDARWEALFATKFEEITDQQVGECLRDAAVLLLQAGLSSLAFKVIEMSMKVERSDE